MNSSAKIRFHRRRYLVNKRLQLTLIAYALSFGAWISFSNFGFQFAIQHQLMTGARGLTILAFTWIVIVCVSSLIFGIVLSNRIAGPIYRLVQHMESTAGGEDMSEIKFRRADYFKEIVEPYNRILALLKEGGAKRPARRRTGEPSEPDEPGE